MKNSFSKRLISFTLISVFSFFVTSMAFAADEVEQKEDHKAAEAIDQKEKYKASVTFNRDTFDQGFDPWNQLSVSLSKQMSFGSLIGRINQANRFDENGTQAEIDAYPRIREGTYAYLNVGYSSDDIFPEFRFGAEVFQSLPQSWEVSLGFRYLKFSSTQVRMYTGTVGKYSGNYYFLFRLNVIPEDIGTSTSGGLQVRRYYGDENYYSISLSTGKSFSQLVLNGPVSTFSSKKLSVDIYSQLSGLWYGSAGLGYEEEEIRPSVNRKHQFISLGVEKRF